MRTLCDVCESAPAILFCAADEAALCRSCDEKVHMCNKLASRHVRVGLSDQSYVRRCEICENSPAFFYCAIDGSSLCSQCDVTVHVGGKRTHERYLLLRQRVEFPGTRPASGENLALQLTDPVESRQEQNQLPKLAIEGNLQNHKVSPVPILNVNMDNHRKMDSPMIDLNTRPQRVHEQSSNAQLHRLGLSHQGDLWGNPSYQQPGSPIHGPDLLPTNGPRIPYISLQEGSYISSIAGAGDGCFKR